MTDPDGASPETDNQPPDPPAGKNPQGWKAIASTAGSGLLRLFQWTYQQIRGEPFSAFMLIAFFAGLIVVVLGRFGVFAISQQQAQTLLYIIFVPLAGAALVYFLRFTGVSSTLRAVLEWVIVGCLSIMLIAFSYSVAKAWILPPTGEPLPATFPTDTIGLTPFATLESTGLFKQSDEQSLQQIDKDYLDSMKHLRAAIEQGFNPKQDNQRIVVGVSPSTFKPPYNVMVGTLTCAPGKEVTDGVAFLVKEGPGRTENTRSIIWRQLPFMIKATSVSNDRTVYNNKLQIPDPIVGERLVIVAVIKAPTGVNAKFDSVNNYPLTLSLESK
jgi:hypothetical protein